GLEEVVATGRPDLLDALVGFGWDEVSRSTSLSVEVDVAVNHERSLEQAHSLLDRLLPSWLSAGLRRLPLVEPRHMNSNRPINLPEEWEGKDVEVMTLPVDTLPS